MTHRTHILSLAAVALCGGCFVTEPGRPPPSPYVEQFYTVTLDDELVGGHTLRELLAAINTSETITMEGWSPVEPATVSNTLSMRIDPILSAPIQARELRHLANPDEVVSVAYTIPLRSCGAMLGTNIELGDANILEMGIGWSPYNDPTQYPDSYGEYLTHDFEGYGANIRCGTHSYWPGFVPARVPQDTLDELLDLAVPANVSSDSLQWLMSGEWLITNNGTASVTTRAGFSFIFDDPDTVSPEPSIPAQVLVLDAWMGPIGEEVW